MKAERTWVSADDFIDLKYKIKQKGISVLLSAFRFSGNKRSVNKWNTITPSSDFWIIPEVRKRWNEKCTGDPDLEYEDYFVRKYLCNTHDLRMLSIGCGTGARERKFGKYCNFSLIEGIDQASSKIKEARTSASVEKLNNLKYYTGDFRTFKLDNDSYDIILFNSSLHHFDRIEQLLQLKVMPLLKEGGYLIIFEYVGPARLQWTCRQLDFANSLLKEIPADFKSRFNSTSIKKRIYRPGLLRMLLVDPSEAVESDKILPAVHRHFKTIEQKKAGWDILHLLLKDIAHNFLSDNNETKSLLSHIFEQEDKYMLETGRSDAVFGIYKRSKAN